jgi:predicted HD superfamily hydrolase involved in NAD metabolism
MTAILTIDELRAENARRLGEKRRAHVAAVAETAAAIAEGGAWPEDVAEGARRAAWIHDTWKEAPVDAWVQVIAARGWEPDPWCRAHAADLLHAEAAAAWAVERGEADPRVVAAVRHHPTGDPGWDAVGRILYVADFCEPTRPYAEALGTAAVRARAAEGAAGLEAAARRVLGMRLRWLVERGRPVHPRSWRTWNAWTLPAGAAREEE